MIFHIGLVWVASVLIIVPNWVSRLGHLRHRKRLNELRAGAVESFFEERRALETYSPIRNLWTYRFLGAALMIYALSSLIFDL